MCMCLHIYACSWYMCVYGKRIGFDFLLEKELNPEWIWGYRWTKFCFCFSLSHRQVSCIFGLYDKLEKLAGFSKSMLPKYFYHLIFSFSLFMSVSYPRLVPNVIFFMYAGHFTCKIYGTLGKLSSKMIKVNFTLLFLSLFCPSGSLCSLFSMYYVSCVCVSLEFHHFELFLKGALFFLTMSITL